MLPERPDPQPLGGVVPARQVVDLRLPGHVHHPLAHLAGDVGVQAFGDGVVDFALRGAADDAHGADRVRPFQEGQRLLRVDLLAALDELGGVDGEGEVPLEADGEAVVLAEGLQALQAEVFRGEDVVAELGVAVQGEVVGEQVQVSPDQLGHAPVLHAGQDARHAVPEDAVVDEDGIGFRFAGFDEELVAGRDSGHDLADLLPALHLQAVRTVVAAPLGVQELVQVGDQGGAVDGAHAGSLAGATGGPGAS